MRASLAAPTVAIPDSLLSALRSARHVCVLTGAGASAESGVPTFRDAQSGLWAKYDPLALATPEAFEADPGLVWRWYEWRRELVRSVEPNAGHKALARLQSLVPAMTLITQNVDGLHQRAGSDGVVEFHGNLFVDRCFAEGNVVEPVGDGKPPVCPACGAPVRPGVVWFGEAIPDDALSRASAAAVECDVFLSIGTSSQVFPAAALADTARDNGAYTVELNPERTVGSDRFDLSLAGRFGETMPELVDSLQTMRSTNR